MKDVIESAEFKKELKKAIECGNDTDWDWEGNDEDGWEEVERGIFISDVAVLAVLDLLKEKIK